MWAEARLRIVAVNRYTVRDKSAQPPVFTKHLRKLMYQPKHFSISDNDQMIELIAAHPLATLIATGISPVQINHIPMLVQSDGADSLKLQCHVARANPLWQTLQSTPGVIAVFCGVQSYISPNWYATKAEHGKVVPTWNYEAVHATGIATVKDDASWLRGFLDKLTDNHEATEPKPWQVGDAPDDYLQKMLGAIVGIEIDVQGLEGKAKLSQNQPPVNQRSISRRLQNDADASALTASNRHEMATRFSSQ